MRNPFTFQASRRKSYQAARWIVGNLRARLTSPHLDWKKDLTPVESRESPAILERIRLTPTRLSPSAAFDLGGIAKGYAVDCPVEALQHVGCAAGWVNAGGDLRVFGEVQSPVMLRDERNGGLHPFMALGEGAVATSYLGPGQRSQIYAASGAALLVHVTVAAPQCMHADALIKVIAASGDEQHPLLRQYSAQAWLHREACISSLLGGHQHELSQRW